MMQVKKLEVVMPIARLTPYTSDAISSIYHQSLQSFSLCYVVYENSYAELVELLDSLSEYKPTGIDERFIVSKICCLSFQLNLAINSSEATFLARMDADDISLSNRLLTQLQYLEDHDDISVVGCKVILINNMGEKFRNFPFFKTAKMIRNVLPFFNPMCHPALMFRTSALRSIGGYRYGRIHEDHDLFLDLTNSGFMMCNIPNVLFYYRRHPNQLTNVRNSWLSFASSTSIYVFWMLRTLNPFFVFGIIYSFPLLRRIRTYMGSLFPKFTKLVSS